MPLQRNTLVTGAAVVAALAAGFGLAKLSDRPHAAKTEEGAEERGAQAAAGFVKLTPAQVADAGIAVVTVGQGGSGDLHLSGRVQSSPDARAVVAAPVAGAVTRVLVAPGAPVRVGDALVVVRSADSATARAEAQAAGAEAETASAALAREDRLMKEGVTPRQDWEVARAASVRASSAAVAARARVAALGGPGPGGETTVRSPITGVVTGISTAPGGFLSQGAPVAEVSNPDRVEVIFSAPPEAADTVKVGRTLTVTSADGAEAQTQVVGVAPMAGDTTGAAVIRARPVKGRLTPGGAVSAALATTTATLPTVPTEAVQQVGGRSVVFVAEDKGFRVRTVTPGRAGAGVSQIVSGLKPGERVAGRGAFLLKAELSKGEAKDTD